MNNKQTIIFGLLLFVGISVFITIFVFSFQSAQFQVMEEATKAEQSRIIESAKLNIESDIEFFVADLLYLESSLKQREREGHGIDTVKTDWISFSDNQRIYDQIRFIGIGGNEQIRINYDPNGSYYVEDAELQNKSETEYFEKTMELDENGIYISGMTLNIENGKVEEPIKPMIRISTPYYDDNDTLQGMMVLNYLAKESLEEMKNIKETANTHFELFLIDGEGRWIINTLDETKEWAHMFGEDESFANEYKEAWQIITTEKQGSVLTEEGYFTFSNYFNPDQMIDNEKIHYYEECYVVSFISLDDEVAQILPTGMIDRWIAIFKINTFDYVLVLLFAASASIVFTVNRRKKQQIEFYSMHDSLTRLYNRYAGLKKTKKVMEERFERENDPMYAGITSMQNDIYVVYIDVNGLKEVNDTLGHQMGDELIVTCANVMKKSTRREDILVRIGGDEFLVVAPRTDEFGANYICEKIVSNIQLINENEDRDYLISVSYGVEKLNNNIDEALKLAEEKMYEQKRIIKKEIKIIRKKEG